MGPQSDRRSHLSTLISFRLAVTFGGRPAETKMGAPGDGLMLGADTSGFPCPASPHASSSIFFPQTDFTKRTLESKGGVHRPP